jgi:hypothetical protein
MALFDQFTNVCLVTAQSIDDLVSFPISALQTPIVQFAISRCSTIKIRQEAVSSLITLEFRGPSTHAPTTATISWQFSAELWIYQ